MHAGSVLGEKAREEVLAGRQVGLDQLDLEAVVEADDRRQQTGGGSLDHVSPPELSCVACEQPGAVGAGDGEVVEGDSGDHLRDSRSRSPRTPRTPSRPPSSTEGRVPNSRRGGSPALRSTSVAAAGVP